MGNKSQQQMTRTFFRITVDSLSNNKDFLLELHSDLAAGVKRLLFCGVGCQVQALRSVETYLNLEKLYVLGTNCVDNGTRAGLDKFLKAVSSEPETVLHYEFMQDYKVHLKHLDGHIEEVPYFCLPANDLVDVITPSCYRTDKPLWKSETKLLLQTNGPRLARITIFETNRVAKNNLVGYCKINLVDAITKEPNNEVEELALKDPSNDTVVGKIGISCSVEDPVVTEKNFAMRMLSIVATDLFPFGLTSILISTDLLCRGFDQSQVNLVINYDLPVKYDSAGEPDYEVYLYRCGRAGRFGRKGAVFNLLCQDNDHMLMNKIQNYFRHEVVEVSNWNSDEDFGKALGLL